MNGPVLSQDTILLLNIYVLISMNCGVCMMITRVLSTVWILVDLWISRIKEDERDVKLLLEMLENHYIYPFVFDAGDLYCNGKQSKSVEKKLF